MTLGLETTGWVDDPLAAVCVVTSLDELVSITLGAQTESRVGYKLVGSEAVVELRGEECTSQSSTRFTEVSASQLTSST